MLQGLRIGTSQPSVSIFSTSTFSIPCSARNRDAHARRICSLSPVVRVLVHKEDSTLSFLAMK